MKKDITMIPVHLGQTVFISGFSFIVADITTGECEGKNLYRFRGYCTADRCNNSIRHSSYNGAVYGGLIPKS